MTEGKPDPPQNLSITGFTESTVGLKWEPTSKKAWTKVDETQSLELTASKLTQGTEYLFRVAAQNAVGVSEFVELQKPAVPKAEFGKRTRKLLFTFRLPFRNYAGTEMFML